MQPSEHLTPCGEYIQASRVSPAGSLVDGVLR